MFVRMAFLGAIGITAVLTSGCSASAQTPGEFLYEFVQASKGAKTELICDTMLSTEALAAIDAELKQSGSTDNCANLVENTFPYVNNNNFNGEVSVDEDLIRLNEDETVAKIPYGWLNGSGNSTILVFEQGRWKYLCDTTTSSLHSLCSANDAL